MEAIRTFGSYQINMTIKSEEIKAVGNMKIMFFISPSNISPSFKVQQILDTWKSAEEGAGQGGMGDA